MMNLFYRNVSIKFFICFGITLLCFNNNSFASNRGDIFSKKLQNIEVFEDVNGDLSAEDVLERGAFKKYPNNSLLNLGVSKSIFWIRFEIDNNSDSPIDRLFIENPSIEISELYRIGESEKVLLGKGGTEFDKEKKQNNERFLVFDLNIQPRERNEYLLRIKGSTQLIIPIAYGSEKGVIEYLSNSKLIFAIYIGIIFVMLFYNFFLFLSVRDSNYLFYTSYLLLALLAQFAINGYGYQYLWGRFPNFENISVTLFSALGGAAAIKFMQVFLISKEKIPKMNIGLNVFIALFFLSGILSVFGIKIIAFQIMQNVTILASLYVFVSSLIILGKGYRPARFFVVAWTILLLGAVAFVLKDFGVLPQNNITSNALIASQALEMILLSFALADKINTYRLERIKAIQEKEQILAEQNVILEKQVEQRTSELNTKNDQLNKAMFELKETQSQLVQSEKMSSLGQLTAGIAHEINNPMNYAQQSILTIKRDIEDLRELLALYDSLESKKDNIDSLLDEIKELKEEIEFEELEKEIDEAIEDVNDGIRRAVEIASELKTFSRIDQADVKLSDVEKGLDSTVELMKSEFANSRIEIKKEYANLPMIECWASKLNQVFMNVLNNAVYAINNSENKERGEILLTTKIDDEKSEVRISFRDNGSGMSEETKSKIFDPFYTTKEVGSGSGLGMSISHGIINEHNGRLEVVSELGKGTEISIVLPMKLEMSYENH